MNHSEIEIKKTNKLLNLFWGGFIIYTVSYTLMISGLVTAKITFLQLLGAMMFIYSSIRLIEFRIKNAYLKPLYIVYMLYLMYVVSRGFAFNKDYLFKSFVDSYFGIFVYLSPLIILIPFTPLSFKKLINTTLILSVFFFILSIIFIKPLLASQSESGKTMIEFFAKILALPIAFVIFLLHYNLDKNKKRKLFSSMWTIGILLLTLLLSIIRARRGLMLISLSTVLIAYLINLLSLKKNLALRIIPIFALFYLIAFGMFLSDRKDLGSFNLISERLSEDTRSGVEDYFYYDFEGIDWIIGRGIDGIYYSPSGATESGFRHTIETDYLQIILKGGLIELSLIILIIFPAIILGLFYSKNILTKAAACWLIVFVISSYPANPTVFNLSYLIVWISIGICYSSELRNKKEEDMEKEYSFTLFTRPKFN